MIREIEAGRRHRWQRGKVIVLVDKKDEIWAEYKHKNETFIVSSVKYDGHIMPIDADVLTILSFGHVATGYLHCMR